MSGVRPKGPERPHQKGAQEPDPVPGESDSPPPYTRGPLWEGKVPKLIMLVASIAVGLMFLIAVALCLVGGIRQKQPRYFLLLTNITLSTLVTGLLIFWYYRRILLPSLLWYILVQCLFLFFQCVATDIFALYETPHKNSNHHSDTQPWVSLTNSTPHNGSNESSIAFGQWYI